MNSLIEIHSHSPDWYSPVCQRSHAVSHLSGPTNQNLTTSGKWRLVFVCLLTWVCRKDQNPTIKTDIFLSIDDINRGIYTFTVWGTHMIAVSWICSTAVRFSSPLNCKHPHVTLFRDYNVCYFSNSDLKYFMHEEHEAIVYKPITHSSECWVLQPGVSYVYCISHVAFIAPLNCYLQGYYICGAYCIKRTKQTTLLQLAY